MLTLTEFVDAILKLLDQLADAKGVARAAFIVEMHQMLTTLKDGIKKDQDAANKVKKFLEDQLRDLNRQLAGEDVPPTEYHLNLNEEDNQNGSESAPS